LSKPIAQSDATVVADVAAFSQAADTVEGLLTRIETNLLVGETIELDVAQGALAALAGSARRITPPDQAASINRLLTLVSDCDRLIEKINRDLGVLRGKAEAVDQTSLGLIAYSKGGQP